MFPSVEMEKVGGHRLIIMERTQASWRIQHAQKQKVSSPPVETDTTEARATISMINTMIGTLWILCGSMVMEAVCLDTTAMSHRL